MIVKPRKGLKVRDHVTRQHIPEAGIEVPDSDSYWIRRLRAGDVVKVEPADESGQKGEE